MVAAALQELATSMRRCDRYPSLQDVDEGLETPEPRYSRYISVLCEPVDYKYDGNDGTIDLHITNSNTYPLESEPARKAGAKSSPNRKSRMIMLNQRSG